MSQRRIGVPIMRNNDNLKFDNELKKQIFEYFWICDEDLKKYVLLLYVAVFSQMNICNRGNDTSLQSRGAFLSYLNLEHITMLDHNHVKTWYLKNFVSENFKNNCLQTYELARVSF